MRLNTLKPGPGGRRRGKRVGRGIGSTLGKTGGRGHKGQRSRSGKLGMTGFEGGQLPLKRRLPKIGFRAHKAYREPSAEVRLSDLERAGVDTVDLDGLKDAGVVPRATARAKIIKTGELTRAVNVRGIPATKGARAAIEAAGGSVE